MTIAQIFCTLNDMEDDLGLRGIERESTMFSKIESASQFLVRMIGRFLPVTETLVFAGNGAEKLFLPAFFGSPLTIINDGTTLVSGDYVLKPVGKHWDNGPYSWLEVATEATNLSKWSCYKDGISIASKFGLYDKSESLGITLGANMTDSVTTMQVSDGSKVSPGMVVVIGSEQILVKATSTPTSAVTTLSAGLDAEDENISVASGSAIKLGEIIRLGFEKGKVLDINSNTAYIARAWGGTLKTTHANSSNVDVYRTFEVERGVNGTTVAAHTSGDAIYQQRVPDDVNFLTRKIAGRMLLDAQGGFKSRLDDNSGAPSHLYILPHELDEIKRNYYIPN